MIDNPGRARYFANLLNERRIRVGMEVGTDLGVFACDLLTHWNGDMLLCVDAYEPYGEAPYNRDGDYQLAIHNLARFPGRAKLIRERSVEAAQGRKYPRWLKIGFIYIDAEHTYDAVKADLAAWWDVLQPGGIFAGHDYGTVSHPGVTKAVNEFAAARELRVKTVADPMPSWWIEKPRASK